MIGWETLALDPPRAVEPAAGRARLREQLEDFQVDERLGFEPSGQGEHWLLRVRKRNANSGWVAAELARQAGVRPFEVGYAGLKDRQAVTTQWFTVPARRGGVQEWAGRSGEGYEVIEAHRHARKLPRGALAGNQFTLVLRGFTGSREALERRVAEIGREGVPNYFGPQRFGRELGNLAVLRGELVRGERFAVLHGHIHRRYHHPATADRPHVFGAGSSTMAGREGYWLIDTAGGRIREATAWVPGATQPAFSAQLGAPPQG